MSFTLFIDGTCPKCGQPVKYSVVELHPDRRDLAIHNFQCVACGPVKANTYSLKSGHSGPELAAQRNKRQPLLAIFS